MNNQKNIKHNTILSRFFSHNITLLVLSFILAFVIWFIISAQTDSSVTISGIPITVELSDTAKAEGLEPFIDSNITASVEVSGNRISVGSLSSEDIMVYPDDIGSIVTPGKYTLLLRAKKASDKTNYQIESVGSPSYVTLRVDRRQELTLTIENRISVELMDSKHYASKTLTPGTIHVSGPEVEISKIAAAAVFDSIEVGSAETTTVSEKVRFYDSDGDELELTYSTTDVDEVEVTIIVMPVKEVELTVDTEGAPENCPEIKIDPETVKIAGSQTALNAVKDKLSIETLSFAALKNEKYSETLTISAPEGCRIISGENNMKATYTIDLSSYETASFTCSITTPKDIENAYDIDYIYGSTVTVEVCGPESVLSSLTQAKITAEADFTNYLSGVKDSATTNISVPIKITLTGNNTTCWVYGTYTAEVNISKK